MTNSMVLNALRSATELGTIQDIYFEGGEPFLFYPILVNAARLASGFKFRVGIVTNGYFANSVNDASIWLRPFREFCSGIIFVSGDTFHGNGDNSLSHSDNLTKAATKLGMKTGTICIDPPCAEKDEHNPGAPILGGGVRFRGKAVEKLIDDTLPRFPWQSFNQCPDENWEDIKRLHLDPYGNLFACQGISIGNINQDSMKEVIDNYNCQSHPIISHLNKGGPAKLVRHYNLDLKENFIDACHLCFLARLELLDQYPEILVPKQVYLSD